MTDVRRRAAEARALLNDPAFQDVCNEIREEATAAFLGSGGNPDQMAAAHERVRAVETFEQALQSRIAEQSLLDKREQQHRGND